ncbi:MAG: DUF262 domain-containing protein [Thermodesulfovibrionales bacterium]|nr:DUF262 domain-containing protein [Thermodesulfovibrionales bacterium]
MATAKPITWQITDVIQWYKKKELIINERFQRYSVWTPQARTYLIDTILQELPIPKIFIRTKLDAKRQTSIREIIDGQQRIRSICEFANDEFLLTSRSEKFRGMKYSNLSEQDQEKFLGYTLTIEHLLNASDDDVIDIFARLNSYTVTLNAAEMRHAKYQTEFKFAVRRCSQIHRGFLEKYDIFSTKQRFRMLDDEFFSQVYQVIHIGVVDGGQKSIDRFYKLMTDEYFGEKDDKEFRKKIDEAVNFFDKNLSAFLKGNIAKHYQILMMFAAYLYQKYSIPKGQLVIFPSKTGLDSVQNIVNKLADLERGVDSAEKELEKFINASSASTQRLLSRKVRFEVFSLIFGK